MKKIKYPKKEDWNIMLKRPSQTVDDIEKTVIEIFSEVNTKGDKAVKKYTELFDGIVLQSLAVTQDEIDASVNMIDTGLKESIQLAKNNISLFHEAQRTQRVELNTMEGVSCWQEKRPIQKVGLYIPGGTAPLFSTVLMLAVPAVLAGCEEIVLCTPPDSEGRINPAILYTAQLCGIKKIYKVGGIQAVAAMTFGTETIPAVYKIFGPGNQFVTVAKQLATKFGVAIDMPAGPSELLVFADETANPAFIASDLLSQAEHGSDSQVILVTTSEALLDNVLKEIDDQLQLLPRAEIAQNAINNSKVILVEDSETALNLINEYGPEHFIVSASDEDFFATNILNAGSVFIGDYTPESAGDYASGTNHTLPTNGYARQYSGLNLDSFMKSITFQKITKAGLKKLGPAVELMAAAEGLQAHKNAVTLRLKEIIENE
ncbi:MAG: histidinol dehydrogenase [Bacteroidia bacterium]|nr:histidinol dehydrogenase [Bacteroidia bacterium]NNF30016.1 histidinol dehydrogenase [Flavobacteriaceae bacterium]MBT8274741.1 histidinol dehydrogenase [Bacteroidia bacterium]NNJ81493.1 histidinol dehydrogenase [Flavobacteriaceae bacterium]NNK53721.1 histidinol dehydrogenase [Flavobacteriaceae bacterium]